MYLEACCALLIFSILRMRDKTVNSNDEGVFHLSGHYRTGEGMTLFCFEDLGVHMFESNEYLVGSR